MKGVVPLYVGSGVRTDAFSSLPASLRSLVAKLKSSWGWYRGFSTKNRKVKGIFPLSYIHLKPFKVDNEGDSRPFRFGGPPKPARVSPRDTPFANLHRIYRFSIGVPSALIVNVTLNVRNIPHKVIPLLALMIPISGITYAHRFPISPFPLAVALVTLS
ncbi:hypothetical protein J437_LFUL010378 [Ladona fulva]|uniref:Uncharacterized protein n=1 Tax=Ladona fulva TaxID=123851 RepID=A0A8K0P5L7_LADFU|nr:hypothetical protein J437_LFUL010378 [Ladona fulva]